MKDVCVDGPNHYLGHAQTLDLMQKEYIYPEIGDRLSPKEWQEVGKPVLMQKARERVDDILATHFPQHIDKATDEKIRENHKVLLPLDLMQPKSG